MDSFFAQLSDSVSSARTLEDLTRPLLEMLEAVTGLESTYLTTLDLGEGLQHVVYARNSRELQIPEGLVVPWGDTLCKRALDEGRPYTDNVAAVWGDSGAARDLGIQTYVSTPVRTDEGALYGTLCAASSRRLPMAPSAQHVLRLFARLIEQHVERERLVEKLQKANGELRTQALTDALTGLLNRRGFQRRLEELGANADGHAPPLCLAVIDVDRFKQVNDLHSHQVGDEVLVRLAALFQASVRQDDLVVRLAGDEFVILFQRTEETIARACCERVKAAVRTADWDVVARGLEVSISIGVHQASPGESLASLLERSDAGMYRDKTAGRPGPAPTMVS